MSCQHSWHPEVPPGPLSSSLLGHTAAGYPCPVNGPAVGKKPQSPEMSIFLHQPETILGWENSWFGSLTQCIKCQERHLMALYLGFFICSTKCSEVPHEEGDIFRLWCSTGKCCCWLCLMKSGWLDAHSASYCRGNAVLKCFSLLKEFSLTKVLKSTSVDFPKTSNLQISGGWQF